VGAAEQRAHLHPAGSGSGHGGPAGMDRDWPQ
jgi:hypothetical protein